MNYQDFLSIVAALERFYGIELNEYILKKFFKFATENFLSLEDFDTSVELVLASEVNYGRFPAFKVFREALNDHKRLQQLAAPKLPQLPAAVDGDSSIFDIGGHKVIIAKSEAEHRFFDLQAQWAIANPKAKQSLSNTIASHPEWGIEVIDFELRRIKSHVTA